MPIYDVTIPGRGTFEVESNVDLTEKQAYDAALSQSKESLKSQVEGVSGGYTRGLRDPIDAMAQMLPRILSKATSLGGTVENDVSRFFAEEAAKVDALNLAVEQKYQEQRKAEGREGIDAKRIAGNIVNPANLAVALRAPSIVAQTANVASRLPYMATVGQKAVQAAMTPTGQAVIGGTAAGMLEPVFDTEGKDFATEKAKQAGIGGLVGGGTQKVISGLGRVISPQIAPEARALYEKGVELTPGQALGGTYKKLEEAFKSIPIAGDVVAGAEKRSIESFNRAVIDDALTSLNVKVPKKLVGREAINFADDAISNAYNKVLGKAKVTADNVFLDDLSTLTARMSQELPEQRATQFEKIIGQKVLDKFKTDTLKGTQWKSIDSELGRLASNYMNTSDADQRLLGSAIKEAQLSLRELLARANPEKAVEIAKANNAFSKFLRVEKAASSVGAQEGVFSPAQLLSASKSLDESLRKGQFARGKAVMQPMAEGGKSVMGANLPDSGTAYRGATGLGVLGAGYVEPTTLLAPLAIGGAYTKPMQDLMRLLIMERPELARQVGAGISRTSPIVSNILTPGLLGEK
jgi:hypothetical protein